MTNHEDHISLSCISSIDPQVDLIYSLEACPRKSIYSQCLLVINKIFSSSFQWILACWVATCYRKNGMRTDWQSQRSKCYSQSRTKRFKGGRAMNSKMLCRKCISCIQRPQTKSWPQHQESIASKLVPWETEKQLADTRDSKIPMCTSHVKIWLS